MLRNGHLCVPLGILITAIKQQRCWTYYRTYVNIYVLIKLVQLEAKYWIPLKLTYITTFNKRYYKNMVYLYLYDILFIYIFNLNLYLNCILFYLYKMYYVIFYLY